MQNREDDTSRLSEFLDHPKRSLWSMAVPAMLGIGLQAMYSTTDMIFIGMLEGDSIAAVAFNMPLFFLVTSLCFGLGSGITVSIAHYVGARDKAGADNVAEHAVCLALIISGILTFVGLTYGRSLLIKLGCPDTVLPDAWEYLKISCFGITFLVSFIFFDAIMAGEGNMKLPVIFAGLGTVLNIALDPLFIFTLGYGVAGAAIASILSQMIVFFLFCYLLFFRHHSYTQFKMLDFFPSFAIVKKIFRVGLPAASALLVMAFGQMVFNAVLVHHSTDAVAAYQIGTRIDSVIMLPIIGIASGLTTIVSMFYGANEFGRLRKILRYGMSYSVGITVVVSILLFRFADSIVGVYSSSLPITETAVVYVRYMCFMMPLVCIGLTSGRVLQGMGRGMPMLVITIVRVLLIAVPLALYFTKILNKPVEWIWISMLVSTCIAVCVAIIWLVSALRTIRIPA